MKWIASTDYEKSNYAYSLAIIKKRVGFILLSTAENKIEA